MAKQRDHTNIFILVIGFIAGSIICNSMMAHQGLAFYGKKGKKKKHHKKKQQLKALAQMQAALDQSDLGDEGSFLDDGEDF